jgi:hypothetical protein
VSNPQFHARISHPFLLCGRLLRQTAVPLLLLPFFTLSITPAHGEILEELWNKYAQAANAGANVSAQKAEKRTPGRLIGKKTPEREKSFKTSWRYRSDTYELHYTDSEALAKTVYGIALYAGDVDKTLDVSRFVSGVLGWHYTTRQLCDWLNAVLDEKFEKPELDELVLVGMLLQDRIIGIEEGRFTPTGAASHVLAASPGKKRAFADNLRHERLHTYWDEDKNFRETYMEKWKNLSAEAHEQAMKKLSRYAAGNEQQLIEEWAIDLAENSNMDLE